MSEIAPTIERAQTDWLATPEVRTWLRHRDFPYDTVPNMVAYVRYRFGADTLERLVETDDQFPQSYAHWWCSCRMLKLKPKETGAMYPVLHKWLDIAEKETNSRTVEAVFALLYKWLDTLSLDRILFSDEQHREQVPRLSRGQIVLENLKTIESRKSTVDYLVEQGRVIFQERGWTVGEKYWVEHCQKYQL